jgi:Rps23 Pro-64 3,4-dihydroxylase Tpa1-like proline 4-hydroxylase
MDSCMNTDLQQGLTNPDLDRKQLAEAFARDGKVRIADVLRPDFADALFRCLTNDVPWRLMYYNHGARGPEVVGRLFPEQRAAMSQADTEAMLARVNAEARTEFHYLYEAYDVLDARRRKLDPGLLLQQFLDFMGSDELFDLVRDVSGDEEFNRVDCHACRYMPGHFLKEHADVSPFETRKMAYVFYFTRDWHPDFGGLTYFLDEDGKVTDTFVPDYNSLTLFKVPVAHCVSQVASFAPRPRNSITGWFTRYN